MEFWENLKKMKLVKVVGWFVWWKHQHKDNGMMSSLEEKVYVREGF